MVLYHLLLLVVLFYVSLLMFVDSYQLQPPLSFIITPSISKTRTTTHVQQEHTHQLYQRQRRQHASRSTLYLSDVVSSSSSPSTNNGTDTATTTSTTLLQRPSLAAFNGKRILPYNVVVSSLSNTNRVAAVYAILNSSYKQTTDGWGDTTEYIGLTQDVVLAVTKLREQFGTEKVAHIRIIAYDDVNPLQMQHTIKEWKEIQSSACSSSKLNEFQKNDVMWTNLVSDALSYVYDDNDDINEFDDDDIDFDDYESLIQDLQVTSDAMAVYASSSSSSSVAATTDVTTSLETVISPFQESNNDGTSSSTGTTSTDDVVLPLVEDNNKLEFTKENVDIVLNEVRPYLISDGGNVAVVNIDTITNNVYLKLQGACGSCPSSTVTMKMGIERVLKEKFTLINEVIAVTDDYDININKDDINYNVIQKEIQRLQPAIKGMGCTITLQSIDNESGIVTIQFIGSSKIQKGVELALLDIPFVTSIIFTK